MWNYIFVDEKAQISAEMILLIGGLLVLVIVVAGFVLDISNSVAGNVSEVLDTARDSTIGKL
ncbi:MAG: hypothetical protein A4E27_00414 [Methanobacterium sp. PtaU1.Bin242]|jgi:uncharacterized protein (UPF0333 family)|nr:MAG: hypothetical protein A4E27_00414 [Methanobacterium sp. PtaU1.Bin242]